MRQQADEDFIHDKKEAMAYSRCHVREKQEEQQKREEWYGASPQDLRNLLSESTIDRRDSNAGGVKQLTQWSECSWSHSRFSLSLSVSDNWFLSVLILVNFLQLDSVQRTRRVCSLYHPSCSLHQNRRFMWRITPIWF